MLEHSIYSVISPEGCASILWKNSDKMREAADALKLTAQHLKEIGVVDKIIKEPLGGAHRDRNKALEFVKKALLEEVLALQKINRQQIKKLRSEKYIHMGSLSSL
jgi:acetyl-CoA carboxylase carboxyl transferase subunit alpha